MSDEPTSKEGAGSGDSSDNPPYETRLSLARSLMEPTSEPSQWVDLSDLTARAVATDWSEGRPLDEMPDYARMVRDLIAMSPGCARCRCLISDYVYMSKCRNCGCTFCDNCGEEAAKLADQAIVEGYLLTYRPTCPKCGSTNIEYPLPPAGALDLGLSKVTFGDGTRGVVKPTAADNYYQMHLRRCHD